MNKLFYLMVFIFITLFFSFIKNGSLQAQSHKYSFNNSLNEISGLGPALTELLSCGATSGKFTNQLISTTNDDCGNQTVFSFNAGGGFSYPNNTALINGTYTIHIFFKFNTLTGYRRIIDFKNGTTDVGLYTSNDCLNFFPNGNIGSCPFFVANTYYLITLVRDGATKGMTIYVNSALFSTYTDASDDYVPATTTTPIRIFRDDDKVSCENAAGEVKYFELKPVTSTSEEVVNTWNSICSVILPLHLTSFLAKYDDQKVVLAWHTKNEVNTSWFEVERSTDGVNFEKVGIVASVNNGMSNSYNFRDDSIVSEIQYYRLKMVDKDGRFTYSLIAKANINKRPTVIKIYPNPVKDRLIVTFPSKKKKVTLSIFDITGKQVMHKVFTNINNAEMNALSLSKGIYWLQATDDGGWSNRIKFSKE